MGHGALDLRSQAPATGTKRYEAKKQPTRSLPSQPHSITPRSDSPFPPSSTAASTKSFSQRSSSTCNTGKQRESCQEPARLEGCRRLTVSFFVARLSWLSLLIKARSVRLKSTIGLRIKSTRVLLSQISSL